MIDPNDKTWAAVKAHIEARLDDAIGALKSPKMDYAETQRLRGRIEELDALLALAPVQKTEAVVLPDAPSY
jgi:hypothetical protein